MRGPLTLPEIAGLTDDDPRRGAEPAAPAASASPRPAATPAEPGDDAVAVAPRVAPGIPVYHLDPAAPWAAQVGARRGGTRLAAALAARVHLTFDDTAAAIRHVEEWEAVFHPLGEQFDPESAQAVDYDQRDFLPEPPAGAMYEFPAAPLAQKAFFTALTRTLKDDLARRRTLQVLRNRALKLYSRAGETPEAFAERCTAAAQSAADAEAAKIRDRFEGRLDVMRRQVEDARFQVEQAALDAETRGREAEASLWDDVVGAVLGGRRPGRVISRVAAKRSMTRKAQQRREGAETRWTGKVEDLEALKDDLAAELADIDAAWDTRAAEVEPVEIPLEKSDITVDEVAIVWLPVA
jgi:hypothetical protein